MRLAISSCILAPLFTFRFGYILRRLRRRLSNIGLLVYSTLATQLS
jgi:hypothetical protein